MSDELHEETLEPQEYFKIASDYEAGRNGKPQDLVHAARYMMKAADAGHWLATYNVGAFYFHGKGLPQDLKKAREWVLKARSLGGEEMADKALAYIDKKEKELGQTGRKFRLPTTSNMTEPEEADKADKAGKKSTEMPGWKIFLFWVCVGGVLWIAQMLDDTKTWNGRAFVGWVVGLAALGIFLNIIWGSTVRETFQNFKAVTKALLGSLLVLLVIGSITECSGGGSSSGRAVELPDNWRR